MEAGDREAVGLPRSVVVPAVEEGLPEALEDLQEAAQVPLVLLVLLADRRREATGQ